MNTYVGFKNEQNTTAKLKGELSSTPDTVPQSEHTKSKGKLRMPCKI